MFIFFWLLIVTALHPQLKQDIIKNDEEPILKIYTKFFQNINGHEIGDYHEYDCRTQCSIER